MSLASVPVEESCSVKKKKKKKKQLLPLPCSDKGSITGESEHRKHKRREKCGGSSPKVSNPQEEICENGLSSTGGSSSGLCYIKGEWAKGVAQNLGDELDILMNQASPSTLQNSREKIPFAVSFG